MDDNRTASTDLRITPPKRYFTTIQSNN
jgi:hypothetical protein